MQTPAPTPAPAQPWLLQPWAYQAPVVPPACPNQRYYRTARVRLATTYPQQRAPTPNVIVYRSGDQAESLEVEVDTGCGSSRIALGLEAALALRDALNDAIEDIITAQVNVARAAYLAELQEELARDEATGATGNAPIANPDVREGVPA